MNSKNTLHYDICVIGAGPAGMMAAINAAKQASKIIVLEQNDKPLKKLYATGNGRCNFTNLNMDGDVYRGGDIDKIRGIISSFDRDDLISFFESMGMKTKDIDGYVYPYNEQARTVASALLSEAKRQGVDIRCDEHVTDILTKTGIIDNSEDEPEDKSLDKNAHNNSLKPSDKPETRFTIITKTTAYTCRSLIIAVGGKASPAHGSDGNLNDIIKNLGHTMIKQKPALVPLTFDDKRISKLQGVRVKCGVSLTADDTLLTEERGEIIFNKDNISGIPVMQMSRYATCAKIKNSKIAKNAVIEIHIDLFPDEDENDLTERILKLFGYGRESSRADLMAEKNMSGKTDITEYTRTSLDALSLCLNEKLASECLYRAGINDDTPAPIVKDKKLHALAALLKNFTVTITGNAGFERAQVTAGGVPLSELDDHLESKIVPGLFIVGELCDVDGTCGGYNLQWAFSSGAMAGRSCL